MSSELSEIRPVLSDLSKTSQPIGPDATPAVNSAVPALADVATLTDAVPVAAPVTVPLAAAPPPIDPATPFVAVAPAHTDPETMLTILVPKSLPNQV